MNNRFNNKNSMSFMTARPAAHAVITGDAKHPNLTGYADFFTYKNGTVMAVELNGLPYDTAPCASNIYAMHIHAMGDCSPRMNSTFSAAGGHYNPGECPHPAHAGDLSPLFGNRGYAWLAFYTERFSVKDIIGKSVIIHEKRDDFTSQPAGDAGGRIGCGVIRSGR